MSDRVLVGDVAYELLTHGAALKNPFRSHPKEVTHANLFFALPVSRDTPVHAHKRKRADSEEEKSSPREFHTLVLNPGPSRQYQRLGLRDFSRIGDLLQNTDWTREKVLACRNRYSNLPIVPYELYQSWKEASKDESNQVVRFGTRVSYTPDYHMHSIPHALCELAHLIAVMHPELAQQADALETELDLRVVIAGQRSPAFAEGIGFAMMCLARNASKLCTLKPRQPNEWTPILDLLFHKI